MVKAKFNAIVAPYMPPEVVEGVRSTIASLRDQIKTYTEEVAPQERREFAKMGDKAVAWVGRMHTYLSSHPEVCPGHVDLGEYEQDLDSVTQFDEFEGQLAEILSLMSGTRMKRSGAAYAKSLIGYDAFKTGARNGVPGSSAALADMAPQFAGRGRRRTASGGAKPRGEGTGS